MQLCEPPAARGAAFGRREQTDLFVEADRVHLRADATPKLADAHDLIVAATAVTIVALAARCRHVVPAIHSQKPLDPPVTGGCKADSWKKALSTAAVAAATRDRKSVV